MFVFVQTIRHRDYFLDTEADEPPERPARRETLGSLGLLLVAHVVVVPLAKVQSGPVDQTIAADGLPKALVEVLIAAAVLMREVRSAARDRLQDSLNLALRFAIASIGLTIPTLAILSLAIGKPVSLGRSEANSVLLVLALFASTLTLGTGRTTVLHGASHLVISATFILIAAVP